MPSPGPRISFNDTTDRLCAELRSLEVRLAQLEGTLERSYGRSGLQLDSQTIANLQEIDLLVQSMAALANFVGRLRPLPGGEEICLGAALANVPLRDMAQRLAGRAAPEQTRGEPELF